MTSPIPPRVVPTLTEVVHAAPAAAAAVDPLVLSEQLVQRVMQRVGDGLEQRVRELVLQVALEQTRDLAPRLHDELESLVRSLVGDALAAERRP